MKNLFLLCLVAISCGTTQNAICPPPTTIVDSVRVPVPVITYEYLYDTILQQQDTAYITLPVKHDTTTLTKIIVADSTLSYVTLHPDPSGDSYPMLQQAINDYIDHKAGWPYLSAGVYNISHPLLWLKIVNGDYAQVCPHIEGPESAKDAPGGYLAYINPQYSNCFAMAVQKAKGGVIRNLAFMGKYTLPNGFRTLDMDTLRWNQWSQAGVGDNRSSPYSGLVIDPFTRRSNYDDTVYQIYPGYDAYYLPNMSAGGSTALKITGCSWQNFVVGTMITPSRQYNAEEIDVIDCAYSFCRSAYATTQAQAKTNKFEGIQVWGNVHTIVDCGHWGFHHSDGVIAPMVDVVNIAGVNHEFIFAAAYSFPITIKRVYAELLFKFGSTDAFTYVHIQDCQIDFQNGFPGVPTPDYYTFGRGIHWDNDMLRLYNANPTCSRIAIESADNFFVGGTLGGPPITGDYKPTFSHVQDYYIGPNWLDAPDDITILISNSAAVYCDRTTFQGYVTGIKGVKVGDALITPQIADDYPELVGILKTYPLGFVTAVNGDTAVLQNMGMGIRSGNYQVLANRLKP